MLKIRLQRVGRSGTPNYRIVVTEHTSSAKSNYLEILGHYNPLLKENAFNPDTERLLAWIKKGAKPSNTVARLLKGQGVKDMESFITEMKDKKRKGEVKEDAIKPSETPPAETTQA